MRGTFYLKSSILNIIYTIYLFKDAETDFLPLCSIESPKEWLAVQGSCEVTCIELPTINSVSPVSLCMAYSYSTLHYSAHLSQCRQLLFVCSSPAIMTPFAKPTSNNSQKRPHQQASASWPGWVIWVVRWLVG